MGLPHPVTTTDEILAAIHTELVAIRGALNSGEASSDAPVVVTEPAAKPAPRKQRTSTAK